MSAIWARDRHYGCRLKEDLMWRGLRTLVMENEALRVTALLDKGLDIVELVYKPRDIDPLYHSYAGVVNPASRMDNAHSIMGQAIDYWPGGWQICFPNGGGPANYRGAELSFHSEAHFLSWDCVVLADTAACVSVRCRARCLRTPFLLERVMTLRGGSTALVVDDGATNDCPVEMRAAWGQHIALGPPFLESGCRIEIAPTHVWTEEGDFGDIQPADYTWPSARRRSGETRDLSVVDEALGTEDLVMLALKEGRVRVLNDRLGVGVTTTWQTDIYPYMWLWLLYRGHANAPTYGRTFTVAIEPFSSSTAAGLDAAIKDGSALTFEPGETKTAPLTISIDALPSSQP